MFSLPEYTQKLRLDNRHLRVLNELLKRANNSHKEKDKKLEEELRKIKKDNHDLKRENNKLKKEIEKLTKTNNRYQVSLFDHGNFKHPLCNNQKTKGGQQGHCDTNREKEKNSISCVKKRIFANTCGKCGSKLSRVLAIKEKLLLDIVLSPQAVKLLLETERQWCPQCQKEILAKHPQSLPFTEYGINIFMVVIFLRFRCLLSFSKIGAVTELLGLSLSPSVVSSLLSQAKGYLGLRYEELVEAVRKGEIMYNDETGWIVRGKNAWMWVMAGKEITVYKAAESRGGGIFKELYGNSKAYSMHDGYACYEGVTGEEKSLFCWSHILRFSFEETALDHPDSEGIRLRERLVSLYQRKKNDPLISLDALKEEMDNLLKMDSLLPSVQNIQQRLRGQKDGLLRALLLTPDGTNNLAERELRPLAIMRYTSSGSDTYEGMETTAVLSSIVRTQLKKPVTEYFPDMQKYFSNGVKQSFWQYCHEGIIA